MCNTSQICYLSTNFLWRCCPYNKEPLKLIFALLLCIIWVSLNSQFKFRWYFMLINVSLKAFNELFPFSWRGNMHFRKAYLLLFQVRYSLLPLCKYLVRNKFFNNLGQFLWFWGTVWKKILINSVFVLFQPESLDVVPIR